jgi:hypothetical protein
MGVRAPLALVLLAAVAAGCMGTGAPGTANPTVAAPSAGSDGWTPAGDAASDQSCTAAGERWVLTVTIKNTGSQRRGFSVLAQGKSAAGESAGQYRWMDILKAGESRTIKDVAFGKATKDGACTVEILARPAS